MNQNEYIYKAVSQTGEVTVGSLKGMNDKEVAQLLQKRGLTPLRISLPSRDFDVTGTFKTRKSEKIGKQKKIGNIFQRPLKLHRKWGRINSKDLITFAEDLAILTGSGIPINRSLIILSELVEKKSFRRVILSIQKSVKEGNTLWEALQNFSSIIPPVFINMVRAGELGGVLEPVLLRLCDYLKRMEELREYLISAMIYPVILSLTALGSMVVLLTVVIPKFTLIFSDMGIALPLSTRILLNAGQFLRNYWWLIFSIAVCVYFVLRSFRRSHTGRRALDSYKLRLPMLGVILQKVELSRFSHTLGTLLSSGLPILQSLVIVKQVVLNTVLKEAFSKVYEDLKQGSTFSRALSDSGVFPSLAIHMIGVGEETGKLDQMLSKIADIYDKDLRTAIKRFTSVFEPIVILLMGLIIGAMVVSMLMAIFSVNEVPI